MTQPPSGGWQAPIETAGPAPGVEFAGFGARLFAYLIDFAILAIISVVVFMVGIAVAFGGIADASGGLVVGGIILAFLGVLAVSLAYFPWFWARRGATPGMQVVDLVVVRDRDGGPIDGGQAILRLIGYWINGLTLYIGFAWILVDGRRRGWHDLIAGTVVIRRVP